MRNNVYSLFLISAFLILSGVGESFCQTPSSFRKIFEQETQVQSASRNLPLFENITHLSYFPDTLPDWFFHPPAGDSQNVFAIGISDPDLPEDEAFEQALFRAKTMAMLFSHTKIEYYRDVFSSDKPGHRSKGYRHRFDTYFRLSATDSASRESFTIIDQHVTQYNESIILVKYRPAGSRKQKDFIVTSEATVLYVEARIGNLFEPQAAYNIQSTIIKKDQVQKTSFHCIQKGRRELVRSERNGQEVEFPVFLYRFTDSQHESNSRPLTAYNGLWGNFIKQTLKHLALATEQSSMRIRVVGENHQPESSELAREVAVKTARLQINQIELQPENLILDMSIQKKTD